MIEISFTFSSDGELIDKAWKIFKSNEWFILLLPIHQNKFAETIEQTYYNPNTSKNNIFELFSLFHHKALLIFAKKEYMNHKNIEELLFRFSNKRFNIDEENDVILCNIYEEETYMWLSKIFDESYKKTGKTTPLYATSANRNVIYELEILQKVQNFYGMLLDYFAKQYYGE